MNRRQFLARGSALAGAMWALSDSSAEAYTPASLPPKGRVLILGAGLAGLAAAWELKQAGLSYTLIEARPRAGGRVMSHRLRGNGPDLTVELGAEWVGENHERLRALCQQLNLPLQLHRFRTARYLGGVLQPPDTWQPQAEWTQTYQRLLKDAATADEKALQVLDRMDWWRYLVKRGIPPQELEMRELMDSTDFGESIRHVSAYAALAEYAFSSPNNECDYKLVGGNSRLTEALLQAIGPENLVNNEQVTAIAQPVKGTQLTVSCASGRQFTGAHVICTLPVAALNQIQFTPDISRLRREALEALQYARITKTSLRFSTRFWQTDDLDILTDTELHYLFHTTQRQEGPAGALCSYTTGDRAHQASRMGRARLEATFSAALQSAYGTLPPVEDQVQYAWEFDPHTRGAYALYGINQWFTVRPLLLQRHGRISFAGEHLGEWQGFMEGAIQTGQDAARALS